MFVVTHTICWVSAFFFVGGGGASLASVESAGNSSHSLEIYVNQVVAQTSPQKEHRIKQRAPSSPTATAARVIQLED